MLSEIELRAEISEHQRIEAALRVSEARYRVLFEAAPFCISMCDSEGTITFVNQALLSVYGISDPLQFVGHYNVYDEPSSDQPALADHFKRTWAGETVHYRQVLDLLSVPYRTNRSDTLYLDTTLFPVPGGEGQRPHIVIIQEDVTSQMQTEQARWASEERLRIALAAARMGVWDWDLRSGVVTWAGNQEDLFGLAPGSFGGTYQAFIDCVHPEDHALVTRALDSALQERTPYDCIFRVVWLDNSLHWMAGVGEVMWDSDNNPVRMIGVNMDITERKRDEEALRKREAQLQLVIEQIPAILGTTDEELRFTSGMGAALTRLNLQPVQLHGMSLATFPKPTTQNSRRLWRIAARSVANEQHTNQNGEGEPSMSMSSRLLIARDRSSAALGSLSTSRSVSRPKRHLPSAKSSTD